MHINIMIRNVQTISDVKMVSVVAGGREDKGGKDTMGKE